MKRILATAAVLALGLGSSAARAEDVTVGVAGPFTGSLASFGQQLKTGFEAVAKDINAAGGIHGKMLKLEYGDDACDPKQAVAVANSMASKKVAAVIGQDSEDSCHWVNTWEGTSETVTSRKPEDLPADFLLMMLRPQASGQAHRQSSAWAHASSVRPKRLFFCPARQEGLF